ASAVSQTEADFHRDLKVRDLTVLHMATDFAGFEPLDVAQALAGLGDGVADCLVHAVLRRADDFDLLVGVVIGHVILPCNWRASAPFAPPAWIEARKPDTSSSP